jgi:hypothetical protein
MEKVEIEADLSTPDNEANEDYLTQPFSTKDIKITSAPILLPSLIN